MAREGDRGERAVSVEVTGRVQGVGFRPHVHGLATALGIRGTVQNRGGAVTIHAEGDAGAVERFVDALRTDAPPLARVDDVRVTPRAVSGQRCFAILPSARSDAPPVIAPDTATCAACLAELFDPADRHYEHAFSSCTDCGPRLTIVRGAPYDRARTTMAGFAMCAECRREYEDPADRRFHAQPIACPACGPRLAVASDPGADPIAALLRAVTSGRVAALKGLGGFHLVCDARDAAVVRTLRARKARPHEPFALMVASVDAARAIVQVDEQTAALLGSAAHPIVLAPHRDDIVAANVAPGLAHLGVMLPYTPLHHLVARALDGVPLVMTSANRHGEPMITDDDRRAELSTLADVVITHDRPIAIRCDDSVVRAEGPTPLRLGRGEAPLELELPHPLATPTLAMGAHLKSAFALGDGRRLVLGPHAGDLDHPDAERSYETLVERLSSLLAISPRRAVLDRHPDYGTRRIAARRQLARVEVFHHHAHLAACMAEHGLEGEVVGVTFDGAGLGPDGTVWGGEILAGGYVDAVRLGHLRAIPLAGGEAAIREPWRVALAYLRDAGIDPGPWLEVPADRRAFVAHMIDRDVRCPRTSSAGRLFDAIAYLTGLVRDPTFDAHGPAWLEAAAHRARDVSVTPYPFGVDDVDATQLDPRPMWPALLADVRALRPIEEISLRFHLALADATAHAVTTIARRRRLDRVVLSGGCFANVVLSRALEGRLRDAGLAVYLHRRVPPNDGGLALGQAAICAARDARKGR